MKNRILLLACMGMLAHAAPETWTRTAEGYRVPTPDPVFRFPRDHGSHPEFRIEWWYITGHVHDASQRRYGFQATFFRYALHPDAGTGGKGFGTNHVFMAHMAVSDPETGRFFHEERLNRDGWDASASAEDLRLRNGNWSLHRVEDETMSLRGSIRDQIEMAFTMTPAKPKVLFGDKGLSRKGADPTAASWYITFPRLKVSGDLMMDGETVAVTGEAWMDHEISSSQLDENQVGWDWLSVRFHDQTEMMVYILRDQEGKADPYSTIAWIDADSHVRQAGPEHFSWKGVGTWKSPETGAVYPIDVQLSGTKPSGEPFAYEVRPLMRAQELTGELGGVQYWEGACEILENGKVIGEAYMELTGYGQSLQGTLR